MRLFLIGLLFLLWAPDGPAQILRQPVPDKLGVDKPVLNVFRMFGLMQGERVEVSGDLAYDFRLVRDSSIRGKQPDINAMASVDAHSAAVLIWNYHDDDLPAPASPVTINMLGLPEGRVLLQHYRVDRDHSNAYTLWKKMESPPYPTSRQYAELEKAGQLEMLEAPEWIDTKGGRVAITMELPRQGVSLLKFSW